MRDIKDIKQAHNQQADMLARSYQESANTQRRLASHCATASEREKHLRKARRLERKVAEALGTRVRV